MSEIYSESEILEILKDIIVTALRVNRAKLSTESRLFPDLGAESLDILDIRFRIEEMFEIKISEGEVINSLGENLSRVEIEDKFTVKSLLVYVQNCLTEKSEV
jgi:acyl carrier protein